jgi:hypothetical protein
MKKVWGMLVLLIFCLSTTLFAEDIVTTVTPTTTEEVSTIPTELVATTTTEESKTLSITLKQAVLYIPSINKVKQFSAFEVIKTDVDQVSSWPKWAKALYAGWSLDAGFAYDDTDILRDGALTIGRKLGTLADFIPLKFPLSNIIEITIYPIGIYVEKIFTDPQTPEIGYGGSYIKAEIKFN